MLENRDYMRAPAFEPRRPMTITLLVVNVIAFVVQTVSYYQFPAASPLAVPPTDAFFALSVNGLKAGYVWQLLTFQFMHGGLLHLLLNCWALYVFGRAVEEALGRRSFLALYFSSGVLGGLLQMLGALVWHANFGGLVVGASAGIFGLIAAFATLYPERQLTLLLFFVVPVNLRAKHLLLLSGVIALLGILLPRPLAFLFGNVAHAAHLGGMIMGIAYVRQIMHWQWNWWHPRRQPRRPPPRELVKAATSKWRGDHKASPVAREEVSAEEFLSREVDPILDKINAHGIQSLTERERKILESAREKMSRR